jgi:hypothetical protein
MNDELFDRAHALRGMALRGLLHSKDHATAAASCC